MPRSPDLAIFVLTTDDRRQIKPITLPLVHARGVINRFISTSTHKKTDKKHSNRSYH